MRQAVHNVKDINGDICFISEAEITKIVAEGGITFFGLTLSETRSLRLLIDYLGWSLPLEEGKIQQLMDKLK